MTPLDPGLGNQLTFSWNPNPEQDLDFYTLKWGAGSGNPVNVVQATKTSFTAMGLTEGQTYCAVLSATNTSGNTSADTTEVCDFPVQAFGVRLPDFIDDLRVSRAGGNDLALDWTEVTTDLYGKPATIVNYEIFRGDAPDYTIGGLTKIGDCPAPCNTFPLPNAATGASQHYRVRAVGADNRPGALGSEAPRGVVLDVERGTAPGDVLLTWTAATTDHDGNPVDLLHYLVFATDTPMPKTAFVDGAVPPFMTVGGTGVEFTPAPQSRFYSVFAVDTRGNMSPE